ncbi:RNA polymerase sigma factor [Dysosmobacter sp. HCP28S3_G4]|uniref:RNA polymerase sigma factor n=1 Tax=Dysosmobacter sp. HCP28S3_G4 TaxID=3438938 RepID=UPI003F8B9185
MATITENALETYLIENQTHFYRLAYSTLRSREDALDAVQSAVCAALEKRHTLRDPDALRTWFYRILMNVCNDQLRQRKRVMLVPDEMLDAGTYDDPAPDDSLDQQVSQLPPEIQTVIRLRFYEELSLQEIASITGWNLSTVKTRLYNGLKKLRIALEGGAT